MVNINSTLMMPSETPVMTVIDPSNTVLSVVKIFALKNPELKTKVEARIQSVKQKFD
jgi:phosphoribosylcarboxyaminoimidazole (NCAIR) mutase